MFPRVASSSLIATLNGTASFSHFSTAVAESGVPGYDVSVWWGVLGPAKMPPEIAAKLETDLVAALQDPNVLSTLGKIGAAPVGSSSRDFDAYMHAEATKWEPVLKAADIRAQ